MYCRFNIDTRSFIHINTFFHNFYMREETGPIGHISLGWNRALIVIHFFKIYLLKGSKCSN